MSISYKCDYCGEPIESNDPKVTFKVDGEHSDGRWSSGYVGHYHTDEHSGLLAIIERENLNPADAPSDCWSAVNDALKLIHQFGQGVSELPGGKVSRHGRKRVDSKPRLAADERMDGYSNWKALELDQRQPFILEALAGKELTVSEICDAIGSENEQFHVYEGTIRPLLKRLVEEGRIDRKPEDWRGRVRYRYFVAGTDEMAEAVS